MEQGAYKKAVASGEWRVARRRHGGAEAGLADEDGGGCSILYGVAGGVMRQDTLVNHKWIPPPLFL